MKRPVQMGLIGFGKVGTGVLKILRSNEKLIEQKVGTTLKIKRICDKDIHTPRGIKVHPDILTTRPEDIINDPDISIVIELMGGVESARPLVLSAIKNGKHIVTANKALLSQHWDEIFSAASDKNVLVYFEASVGGGIPIIQALNEGLAANKITQILGILNGTTNYILTRMTNEKLNFKEALECARSSGFSEANPKVDVEGEDAVHKLAILASLAFSTQVPLKEIYCEGINRISVEDIQMAKEEFGYIMKLLAIMKVAKEKIELRVHPTLIPESHLLTSVNNENNAIYITGDAVGETMFYGAGAGQMPAASAVVSDIIYLARNISYGIAGSFPHVIYERGKKLNFRPMEEIQTRYYIRFTTVDKPGVLAQISGILGKNNVSIASVYQKEHAVMREVPILMITHQAKEGDLIGALKEIDRLPIARKKSVFIRIEEND